MLALVNNDNYRIERWQVVAKATCHLKLLLILQILTLIPQPGRLKAGREGLALCSSSYRNDVTPPMFGYMESVCSPSYFDSIAVVTELCIINLCTFILDHSFPQWFIFGNSSLNYSPLNNSSLHNSSQSSSSWDYLSLNSLSLNNSS